MIKQMSIIIIAVIIIIIIIIISLICAGIGKRLGTRYEAK